MKKKTPKESASEKANPSPSNPVAIGERGEPVREWCWRKDGETDGEFYRRAFEWDGAELSGMGAASFERWKRAQSVVSRGFRCAINNGAGFDEILTRPEMLRAFDCLINDPPQIARELLAPNPNPIQGGGNREMREWFISTIQEYADNIADESGRVFSEWYTPPWGMSLTRARFEMFPVCLNLAAVALRQEWAHFITVCGLPEFCKMRELLERDRIDAGRGYVQMPALYDCEFSEEQYFDLNTGESNPPKYGGGGVRATNLLLSFRDYLRARQGVRDCEPVARPNPSAAQGANPSARDTAKPSEPVGNGAAVVNITAAAVNVQAATVEMPEPKAATDVRASEPERNAGHTAGGVSQTVMAGFMGVVKKTVSRWENNPGKYKPPTVDGKRYEKGIRENGAGAFVFAQRYKDTQKGAVKITRGAGAIGKAEKQAAESWIRENYAALRSVGADLSEW